MKKLFIKGTDFELPAASILTAAIPVSWTEEREVMRPEPEDPSAIEVDKVGRPWWRPRWGSPWFGIARGIIMTKSWEQLQKENGPTKPAKVVEE